MQRVKHWVGGTVFVGLLAAGLGGCGESSSSKGDDGSDGGGGSSSGSSTTGANGGSGGGSTGANGGSGGSSTGANGGTTDGAMGSTTGNETASSSVSGNTTGGTVPDGPLPLEDYTAELNAILCNWLAPCCAGVGLTLSESACTAALGAGSDEEQASGDPNNYTYDPAVAGDCVAAARELYEHAGCAVDSSVGIGTTELEVCDDVFQGKLEPGAPCVADIECAAAPDEGAECKVLDFETDATVCVVERRAAEGEPCYWTCTEEASGAYGCAGGGSGETPAEQGKCYTNDHLYCADGVCVEQLPLGDPCPGNQTCAEGYCSAAGECSTADNEGADCTTDSQCSEGLYCENPVCTLKKAMGESCAFGPECQSEYCNAESECSEASEEDGLALACALVALQL